MKKTDGKFSRIAHAIADAEYPSLTVEDWYIDIMTAKLVDERGRADFQVFLLPNLYGDIITDEEGNPIQGIKVTLVGSSHKVSGPEVAVFTTNKDGKFESEYYNEMNTNIYKIDFTDTDGELNGGEFAPTSIKASEMKSTQTKENDTQDRWYRGQFERKAEVKLYPQERDKEQVE